jgi:uncharacterized protein
MIWTKYNHLFESSKFGYLLYNSITNSFLKIDEEIFKQLNQLKDNPSYFTKIDKELIDILKSMCVVFDGKEVDVLNVLKMDQQIRQFDKTNRGLTIIPTLDCNFKCGYCFEQDTIREIAMSDIVEEKLINFITSEYENDKNLKQLNVVWFGGEPLLAYNRICRISESLIKKNIPYKAQLITNGYLLTNEIIENLSNIKITEVQITIDGNEKTHNERRPHKTENNSYSKILENIKILDNYNKIHENKISISLRLNVDHSNKELYAETAKFLIDTFATVNVYPGIIKGEINSNNCNHNCFNYKDQAEFIIDQYENYNNSNLNFFPYWFGLAICSANRFYDHVIGPEGEMYSCWNEIGRKEMIIGNIFNNSTNKSLLAKYISGINPLDSKECKNCFYLPICGGGCPYDRVQKKYFDNNIETCCQYKGKKTLEKLLEIHYEIKEISSVLS